MTDISLFSSEKRPDLFTIQYGVLRITESFPNVVRINKIIKHEGYKDSGNYPNDIAILEVIIMLQKPGY